MVEPLNTYQMVDLVVEAVLQLLEQMELELFLEQVE
jgi:hypothetical protein